jgi:hypothetical protein
MKTKRAFKKSSRRSNRTGISYRSALGTYDFSAVEDNKKASEIIRRITADAGAYAAAEAKAAGISRSYIRNNEELVTISAAGITTSLKPVVRKSSFYIKYKPSTVLHAVSK